MKLKIIQSGWQGFTGEFGGVEFDDGVSVDIVSKVDAQRLANLVLIETLEGKNPSSSQMALDSQVIPMSTDDSALADAAVSGVMAPKTWLRSELEDIVEKGGISALRAISTPMGLKSNAAAKLIEMIIDKQTPAGVGKGEGLLMGSDKFGATFEIGTQVFQLGDFVRLAFDLSAKSVTEWNELPQEVRDELIGAQLKIAKGDAPEQEPAQAGESVEQPEGEAK